MKETEKSRRLWGDLERSILVGEGIDIGCGDCPVSESVRCFDIEHGDANLITQYVSEDFDFVFSSHCLEHMNSPREAILEWWKLVRVGGHIFFIVPDEDLYEQGVFPSRFNSDHKATFTISKRESWSPVSINVLDLASSLPGGQVVSLQLQDHGYDRRLYRHDYAGPNFFVRKIIKLHGIIYYRTRIAITALRNLQANAYTIDQTATHGAVAQIQCIVKKVE